MTTRTETAEKARTSRARRTSWSFRSSLFRPRFFAVSLIVASPSGHLIGSSPSFLTRAWPSSESTKSTNSLGQAGRLAAAHEEEGPDES